MKRFICVLFIMVLSFNLSGCSCDRNTRTLGVWWWDDTLDIKHLDFADDNGVNEIYYCSDNFDDDTAYFISKANSYNIRVYWLAGEYKWLDDSTSLYEKIEKYNEYQNKYNEYKFEGIHLDIEPHQNPEFSNNRNNLIAKLISLADNLKKSYPNITFDYDLPFWLEDLIEYKGENKEAYKYMIDIANRVFLMSYRDTAEEIYDVSEEEIEYAKSNNKILVLGVETKSNEGDKVSFKEEGKSYMYEQLELLKRELPEYFGVTIHHIKSWYELKE